MVCYYITAFNKLLTINYIGANYRFLQNHQSSISPSFKKSKGVKNDRQLPLPEIHKASGYSLASLHTSLTLSESKTLCLNDNRIYFMLTPLRQCC